MKYQFRTDIETKVPTCALIENYQDLSIAIQNGDWDLVEVVAESASAPDLDISNFVLCFTARGSEVSDCTKTKEHILL